MTDPSEKEITAEAMDRWLITAMCHMKTIYEDNGIPWSEEDEAMFQAIRRLIEKQGELEKKMKVLKERAKLLLHYDCKGDIEHEGLIQLAEQIRDFDFGRKGN